MEPPQALRSMPACDFDRYVATGVLAQISIGKGGRDPCFNSYPNEHAMDGLPEGTLRLTVWNKHALF
jgi:hypothetical protein